MQKYSNFAGYAGYTSNTGTSGYTGYTGTSGFAGHTGTSGYTGNIGEILGSVLIIKNHYKIMPDPNKINLQRYADGTPSVMRKKTVYTQLHFFRKSDVLVQLTKSFCDRFFPKYGDRTVDQMVQASRSIKQNIAEGFTDGQTSFETEIKLLGIAKGSNQELLEDYQDYLKHHNMIEWSEGNKARFDKLHAFCKEHSDDKDFHPFYLIWTDEEMANLAICLCHMVDRAMTKFMETRDREFVEEGGVRERMTAARLDMRGTQKQIIAQLEAENASLRAKVASLQRELEQARMPEKPA